MMFKNLLAVTTFVVIASAQDSASQAVVSDIPAPANAPVISQVQGQAGDNASATTQGAAPGTPSPATATGNLALPQNYTTGPDTITAHPDAQCERPLNDMANNQFPVTEQYSKYNTFPPQSFPGAEAPDNTGGWNVWWKIPPNPDSQCRYIIMLPYPQKKGSPDQPPGVEIINVAQASCYFSNIPVGSEIYMTKCCGDQCGTANLEYAENIQSPSFGNQDANSGQGPKAQPAPGNAPPVQDPQGTSPLAAVQPAPMKRAARAFEKRDKVPKSGSHAAKAKALVSRFWYDSTQGGQCNSTLGGTSYERAGKQVIVSQPVPCQFGACSASVTYTQTYSTTLTSSHEVTLTHGVDASITVEAGVDFIGDAKISTTLGYSFSKAVADATGQEMMSGVSTAMAYNVPFMAGQRSAVTFTPQLKCWSTSFNCDGTPQDGDFCQPITTGEGDQTMVVGDISVIVLDSN